jgi:hypothetical protein
MIAIKPSTHQGMPLHGTEYTIGQTLIHNGKSKIVKRAYVGECPFPGNDERYKAGYHWYVTWEGGGTCNTTQVALVDPDDLLPEELFHV